MHHPTCLNSAGVCGLFPVKLDATKWNSTCNENEIEVSRSTTPTRFQDFVVSDITTAVFLNPD